MLSSSTVDELLAAASAVSVTFANLPASPIAIKDASALEPKESSEIVDRYWRHGFATFELKMTVDAPRTMLSLANSLDLGPAFVPPLYTQGGRSAPVVSRISAAHNAGSADADHPSFGKTAGQELHCDGTLQPLGFIKASLLLCESPAEEGGDTRLFNASAAFSELAKRDPSAAVALASHGVLVRQANINGSNDQNVESAFTIDEGRLICGYSVTQTDRWETPHGIDETALRRGITFLKAKAVPGSGVYQELRLGAGQTIIFDNTRISHGRTAYVDSRDRRRSLFRSLHLRHPSATVRISDTDEATISKM